VAKLASNSTYQLQVLEFVAASLEESFSLSPEPLSPLYAAVQQVIFLSRHV